MASLEVLREQTALWLECRVPANEGERSAWVFHGLTLSAEVLHHMHAHELTPLDRERGKKVFQISLRLLMDKQFSG